jgi:integrase
MIPRSELIEDEKMSEFLMLRQLKPNTVKNYTIAMRQYCEFRRLTPTELIEEADREEEKSVKRWKRKIKLLLFNFCKDLRERDKQVSTIKLYLVAVKSFYREFDITLPNIRIRAGDIKRETNLDIPKPEDIKLAVENSNTKYKAIILLMASSGMGAAEITSLKVRNFYESLDIPIETDVTGNLHIHRPSDLLPKNPVPAWHIKRVKINMEYYTFSSPESVDYIIRYLQSRQDLKPDEFLFPAKGLDSDKQLKSQGLARYFSTLNNRCRFSKGFFHSHALRKYFASQLINKSNIPKTQIDWLMGHKPNKQDEAYFKSQPDELKSKYIKALEHLVVMEKVEVREMTDERLQELEREIEDVKKTKKILEEILGDERVLEELSKRYY